MNGSLLISLLTGQVPNQASAALGIVPGGADAGALPGLGLGQSAEFKTLLNGVVSQQQSGELVDGAADASEAASLLATFAAQANPKANAVPEFPATGLSAQGAAFPQALAGASSNSAQAAIEAALALNAGTGNPDTANTVAPTIDPDAEADPVLSRLAGEIALGVDNVGTGTSVENVSGDLAGQAANKASADAPQTELAKVVGHVPDKPDGKTARNVGARHANAAAAAAVLASAAAVQNPVFGNAASNAPAPSGADSQIPPAGPAAAAPTGVDAASARQTATAANARGQLSTGDASAEDGPDGGQSEGKNDNGRDGNAGRNSDGRLSTSLGNFPSGTSPTHAQTSKSGNSGQASPQIAETVGTIPNTAPSAGTPGPSAPQSVPLDLAASSEIFFSNQNAASASANSGSFSLFLTPASLAAVTTQQDAPSLVRNSSFVANQVGLQISKAVADGDNTFKLKLNPPELGRVEARLEFSGDRVVKAHIVAENRETLNLLQRDAHVLERALSDSGVRTDSGSLSFSLKQQDSGAGHHASGNGVGHSIDGDNDDFAGAVDVTEAIVTQMISDSAVDITV